jgi:multiple antibiotic resistance protein
MDFASTALLLFIVLDPLGNVPLYLSQLRTVPEQRRRFIAMRELIIAYIVLLVFFFAGAAFMKLLALDINAVKIAGGIILFLIAIKMIFPTPEGIFGNAGGAAEPFIVPLAVPAVAGPGALSVVLLLREAKPHGTLLLLGALTVAWLASAVILCGATKLQRILREEGLLALERLMGLLLVVIAVQMFLESLQALGAIPA